MLLMCQGSRSSAQHSTAVSTVTPGDPAEAGEKGCKRQGGGGGSGEMDGGQRSAVQHVRLADQEVLSLASGSTQGVLCFGHILTI